MQQIVAHILKGKILSNTPEAHTMSEKSQYGENDGGAILYMPEEALYLVQTGKMNIRTTAQKQLGAEEVQRKLINTNKRLEVTYPVYKDLRSKGHIPKSALKFGADFRVYTQKAKVGKQHSEFLAYCDSQHKKISYQDLAAKSRVAHSTKKALLICVVDAENSVTYYAVNWQKIV